MNGYLGGNIVDTPIRVLCLFTILNRGGAETMCMNLYRNIDRSLVQFDFLVYYQQKGDYEDEIEKLGGHVYRIPHLKNISAHIKGARNFFKEHKEYSIVHNHMQSNGCFICREANKAGVKTIIYHSHAAPRPLITKDPSLTARRIRNHLLNKISLQNSNEFFACGESAAKALPEGKEKIILYNAINLDAFKFNPAIRKKIREANNVKDKLIIGNVARFDWNKNQRFAIEVFRELLKKKENVELWLIGDGEMKQDIEKLVHDLDLEGKVILFGVRTDVNELLQAMDIYLFPSIAEGLSVACIEAQAAGLPCIFSDGFDPHTAITDHCKIMSLSESPKAWADAIIGLNSFNREDESGKIRKAGYDIKDTSEYIKNYYLSRT